MNQVQEVRLQLAAETAIKQGISRDDFYSDMYNCFGYEQADYALQCYDEITYFIVTGGR